MNRETHPEDTPAWIKELRELWPVPAAPARLDEQVFRLYRLRGSTARPRPQVLRLWLATAAAVATLLLGAVVLWRAGHPQLARPAAGAGYATAVSTVVLPAELDQLEPCWDGPVTFDPAGRP